MIPPDTWSILRTSFAAPDAPAAAPILNRWCGMPPAEAALRVRADHGIVARGLNRPEAESAAAELTAVGVPATAVPDSLTLPPPPPYLLRQATATAEAFVALRDLTPQELPLPWDQILVVAAGRVTEITPGQKQPETRAWRMTGVSARSFQIASAASRGEQSSNRDRLQIIGGSPLQHYRIDSGRFNYARLLPQPAPVAEANFCLMVTGLLQMAPRAATNILAEHIGPGGSVALAVFPDPHAFDHRVTWLFSLARLYEFAPSTRGAIPDYTQIVNQNR